jgi:hypothetical protein
MAAPIALIATWGNQYMWQWYRQQKRKNDEE